MRADFVYLFLCDPFEYEREKYLDYVERENGYGPCLLNAYLAAFEEPKDGKITIDLLKKIHKYAMAFQQDAEQLKTTFSAVPIAPVERFISENQQFVDSGYNITSAGLNELIHHWFISDEISPLSFIYKLRGKIQEEHHLYKKDSKLHQTILSDKGIQNNILNEASFIKAVNQIYVTPGDYYLISLEKEPHITLGFVNEKILKKIIGDYEAAMEIAHTDNEKITTIAKYLQRIQQFHPFKDGNARTIYVLLNKLLRDYNLPLTILLNPNRLDGWSLNEVVGMITQGQIHFRTLCEHEIGNLILVSENELLLETQQITFRPQALFDIPESLISRFIQVISNPNRQELAAAGPYNRQRFFSVSVEQDIVKTDLLRQLEQFRIDKSYVKLFQALDKGEYELGFRIACAGAKDPNIPLLILDVIQTLDLNPLAQSTNGNTAIDWLNQNGALGEMKIQIQQRILLTRSLFQ